MYNNINILFFQVNFKFYSIKSDSKMIMSERRKIMRKALVALMIALALAVVCNPISAKGTDPEGCSAEHPELCIEPRGCSSPDCMFL